MVSSIGDLTDNETLARILGRTPARGGFELNAGFLPFGAGFEVVSFDSPSKNALYVTGGSGIGKTIPFKKGKSSFGNPPQSKHKPGASPPPTAIGNWISHTPTPRHYEGPFIGVKAAVVLPELRSPSPKFNAVVNSKRDIGGHFAWSPTVTFRGPEPDGEAFCSHGLSGAISGSKTGLSFAIDFTWYGLIKEWARN